MDNETYLFGYSQLWFTFDTISNSTPRGLQSFDDRGYFQYYYYCGDMSGYLNTTWVPVMTWLLVNILPGIILSIIVLMFTLKTRCVLTSCTYPGIIFTGMFSHLHIGPVRWSKSNSGCLSFSPTISFINILLTFLGLCLHFHLTIAGFGAGDSSQLRFVLPFCVCIPIFLISAILATCILLHRARIASKLSIYNPSDPARWYVMDTDDNVVPEVENVAMEDVPYEKI